jgi:hypothetical protein
MGFTASNVQASSEQKTGEASTTQTTKQGVDFSKQEIEFLLALIKNSTFKGEMIEIIYHLVYKLQEGYNQKNK